MKRFLGKIFIMILSIGFIASILNFAFALNDDELFGTNSGVVLKTATDRMIYKLDQPIIITSYLKNKTGKPIDIVEPAIDKTSFMIEITKPDGKKDKLIDIGVNLKTLRLYPDKRIKFTTKFLPEMAGNYDIKVIYLGYRDTISTPPIRIFVVSAPLVKIQPDD